MREKLEGGRVRMNDGDGGGGGNAKRDCKERDEGGFKKKPTLATEHGAKEHRNGKTRTIETWYAPFVCWLDALMMSSS